ncbi:leucyl aminopeptidase [Azohydromonas sp.]|uniref:leucyl aminopeptidase n=1 Tax=Azohydromonas sp. TaxID=1872666 RepID=UPI002C389E0B|nr:leucyl aminopeptidase [Azohydromonas sp.]HMM86732.1 leucyl aminopeptidase [Azohydromonas sp.]
MDLRTQTLPAGGIAAVAADALLVVLVGDKAPPDLDAALAPLLDDAVKHGDFELKPSRTLYLHRPAGAKVARLAFAAAADASPKSVKAALAAGLAALKAPGVKRLAVALAGADAVDDRHAEALALAVADAVYLYRHTKPSAPAPAALASVTLLGTKAQQPVLARGLARGEAIAAGVTLARECANRPANHLTPGALADQASALAKSHGLKAEVLERKHVEKLGMGAFLAVAQGSHEPLRFIVLRYQGAGKTDAPVVLVGKGITFDTGGISLKPAAEMDEMKFDMGGAASVLGTMRAVAQLKPKVNVVALIPACENMPGGRAVKPGDVVTSMSGQTIEILNTDAEGRLILCDALTYAARFKPQAVVDVATLTGACMIALGHHHSGLFSADDALAADLLAASAAALDPAWRMPLDAEYDEALKSNFADMANVGPRAGGAITAAKFLQRFAKDLPWAHLDIAGTAWKSGTHKGATGRPVGLLTHFVLSRAR